MSTITTDRPVSVQADAHETPEHVHVFDRYRCTSRVPGESGRWMTYECVCGERERRQVR